MLNHEAQFFATHFPFIASSIVSELEIRMHHRDTIVTHPNRLLYHFELKSLPRDDLGETSKSRIPNRAQKVISCQWNLNDSFAQFIRTCVYKYLCWHIRDMSAKSIRVSLERAHSSSASAAFEFWILVLFPFTYFHVERKKKENSHLPEMWNIPSKSSELELVNCHCDYAWWMEW